MLVTVKFNDILMQHLPKRIFFWTLVLLFFVTTPLVIFYSMGYRFSAQRGIFVYTGSISIKSNPLDIQIFIDQELKNKSLNRLNNTYHIGGIKPGDHLIEIKAPGFSTWSKKITVNSGTSTEFWNVLLIKDDYEKTAYSAAGIQKIFLDPGKKMVAYTLGENKLSVNVLDIESNESENVFSSEEYEFTSDEKENIEWSPQSKKIIIPASRNGKKSYFMVDVKTKEIINLEDIAENSAMEKVRWDRKNKDFIYYISGGDLHYLDTQNSEDNKIIAKNISSYDLSSGYVYFFQLPGGIVYRINYDGSGDPEQITTSAPDKMGDPNYQTTVYDQDRISLLNKSGELYIYNYGLKDRYFRNLSSGISEIQFSDDGKKMLYWNDREISVYFTRDWEVQPWRNENEQREITRFSDKIKNVQWSKDYEHVIFSVGSRIKTAEIDHRSQNNISDIFTLNTEETKIVSDFSQSKLYFINQENDENNLYSLDFPESTGIFFGIGR